MSVHVAVILSRKGSEVITITPDATLADAAKVLSQRNIGALVVSEDGRTVLGVLSERDIVRCMADVGADALQARVADAMTSDVTTCRRQDTADQLMATMTAGRMRHLPVVEDGELVGIVSIGDVVKSRMDELEVKAERLQHYVTGNSY